MTNENDENILNNQDHLEELSANVRPLDLYKLGIGLYECGKYTEAIQAYTKALVDLPEFESIYYHRAMAYEMQGAFDKAIPDITKYIQLSPHREYSPYVFRARLYRNQHNYSAALVDYSEALQLNPESWNTYLEKGELEYEIGNYEAAISDVTLAIKSIPRLIKGFRLLGQIHNAQGNYDDAIKDYSQVIEMLKADGFSLVADDFYNRGFAFAAKQARELALADYKFALQIAPNHKHSDQMNGYMDGAEEGLPDL